MKKNRHNAILNIVKDFNIETQDELLERLREKGYEVTQATISRDIRELKLVKNATGTGEYIYAVQGDGRAKAAAKYRNIITETIISVDAAENLIVIKTFPGMAQAAGAAVDGMGWNEIVGCIAGDDTLLVVMRNRDKALEYTANLKDILKL